jgi:hypothetical protein
MRYTWLAPLLGAVVLVLGVLLSTWGPPRLIWLNTGLRADYPWPRAAGALLAAAGAGLLVLAARRSALRAFFAILAATLFGFALQRAVYRLEAGAAGLAEHGLRGSTRVAWRDVARVDSEAGDVVVVTTSGERLRLGTRAWDPQAVAQLERTIARRVREASQ